MRDLVNVEYEECLIASILLDNSIIDSVEIPADCITSDHRQFVYKTILQMIKAGKQANIQTVIETCRQEIAKQMPTLWHDFISGDWMITALTQMPSSSNASFYAENLVELSQLRKIYSISKMIDELIYNPAIGSESMRAKIESELSNLELNKSTGFRKLGEMLPAVVAKIEKAFLNKGQLTGVPSGFPGLDAITSGFQGKQVYVIGARPGTGKTSIALNMAESAFLSEFPCGFISCEMDGELLAGRMLSALSAVDKRKYDSGYLGLNDFSDMNTAIQIMNKAEMYIDDTPNIQWNELVRSAKKMIRINGIKILFIDYIGLISGITESDRMPRNEQVKLVSKNIKKLARDTGLPIVVLSQLGRDAHGQRPNAAQLRESGSIEEDADGVILLWDKGWQNEDAKEYRDSVMIVEKMRNCAIGDVEMIFKPSTTRFSEKGDEWKRMQQEKSETIRKSLIKESKQPQPQKTTQEAFDDEIDLF